MRHEASRWPADLFPYRQHEFARPAGVMRYVDEGRGAAVVCVHGNPTWSFYFRGLIAGLRETHRVVAPDHVGCGWSDRPSERKYAYCLRSRIDDLEALLEHLGLGAGVTLVGHDWGGMIAAGVAVRRPSRVSRLVMMNTAAFLPPPGKRLPWRLRVLRANPGLAAAAVLGGNAFARLATRMAVVRPLPRAVRAAYLAPYGTWSRRRATLRFVQDIPLHEGDRSYGLVREIDERLETLGGRPMLLVWGLRDFVFDGDYLAEWRRRFPEAEVLAFADAGHWVLEDAGERVVERVRAFLARRGTGAERAVGVAGSDA